MKHYKVPVDLFENLKAYLATRPFQEVAGAMQVMGQLRPEDDVVATNVVGIHETPGMNEV